MAAHYKNSTRSGSSPVFIWFLVLVIVCLGGVLTYREVYCRKEYKVITIDPATSASKSWMSALENLAFDIGAKIELEKRFLGQFFEKGEDMQSILKKYESREKIKIAILKELAEENEENETREHYYKSPWYGHASFLLFTGLLCVFPVKLFQRTKYGKLMRVGKMGKK